MAKYPYITITSYFPVLRDLLLCLLSSLNILIFSFIGLNYEAFAKIENYAASGGNVLEFDVITSQMQSALAGSLKDIDPGAEASAEQFLVVPKINVISPIAEMTVGQNIEEHLKKGVVALSSLIPPEKTGQTILFGHSSDYPWKNNPYATVFTLLPHLEKGDLVKVIRGKRTYQYTVKNTLISDANLTELKGRIAGPNELVLSTCYPIGFFTKRFNVIATPSS